MVDLTKIAVAGLGAIGADVVRCIAAGDIPAARLAAVSARDLATVPQRIAALGAANVPALPIEELAAHADVVVECLPAARFALLAESVLGAGKILVALSAGALLDRMDLIDLARGSGGRIIVPTGALLGLDAVRAAAQGEIHSVTMISRKPPGGFAGAPLVIEKGIDLDALTEPLMLFAGPAAEAVRHFPANVNVAAALSLAGMGPERTRIQVWADPGITRNTHSIRVESDSAALDMTIANIPTAANPRTGRIVAGSVIAALRRLSDPLVVGS
ncbi:MAG: aspartate dehydrogenase [Pseudomonadota bacterium]|nr:aspartate dehydrogenase [Pseudomonadota bacterium]